jgi:hypothetical protein
VDGPGRCRANGSHPLIGGASINWENHVRPLLGYLSPDGGSRQYATHNIESDGKVSA